MKPTIDIPSLYAALDKVRIAKDWSWYRVAQDTDITQSTFTRLKNGKQIDFSKLFTLAKWCGADAERFIASDAK